MKCLKLMVVLLVLGMILPGVATHAQNAAGQEWVFFNGTVLTMDAENPQSEAILIRDDRIAVVGSYDVVMDAASDSAQQVDLQGRTVMPGFVDPHTHLLNDQDRLGVDTDGAQQLALENGITTLGNLYVSEDFLLHMQDYAANGNMRIRASLYLIYTSNCGEVQGTWYQQYPPTREPGEMLRVGGIKIFADGGTCGPPALSYELIPGNGTGELFLSQEQLTTAVTEADALGYQVAIHALGDRAVEAAQNAIAATLNGQPNTLRHRIDHNAVIRPELLPRYEEIGIVALIFGQFPWCNPFAPSPPDYQSYEWPWRALLDANPNAHIAWHGDDPWIGGVNPLVELYGLVTRNDVAPDGTVCEAPDWFKANAITVEEALPMMTIEGAYALFREDEVGSLEPGKFADLIILSDNPLTVEPEAIKDIDILLTMVGGTAEYCDADYSTYCTGEAVVTSNDPVIGYVDFASCEEITGWAWDPRTPNESIEVALYARNEAGEVVAAGTLLADQPREDLQQALGDNGAHGFWRITPPQLKDGQRYTVFGFGLPHHPESQPALLYEGRVMQCP